MAAQAGKDMLIKVSDDGTSGGNLNILAGLRSSSISMNAEPVDVSNADSADRFREILAGAGMKSISISGSGVFKDEEEDEDLRGHFFAGSNAYLQFLIPDFGTISGEFHISNYEFSGDHDDSVQFSATFDSAGDMTWAAV